jgi:hypothetical protein
MYFIVWGTHQIQFRITFCLFQCIYVFVTKLITKETSTQQSRVSSNIISTIAPTMKNWITSVLDWYNQNIAPTYFFIRTVLRFCFLSMYSNKCDISLSAWRRTHNIIFLHNETIDKPERAMNCGWDWALLIFQLSIEIGWRDDLDHILSSLCDFITIYQCCHPHPFF